MLMSIYRAITSAVNSVTAGASLTMSITGEVGQGKSTLAKYAVKAARDAQHIVWYVIMITWYWVLILIWLRVVRWVGQKQRQKRHFMHWGEFCLIWWNWLMIRHSYLKLTHHCTWLVGIVITWLMMVCSLVKSHQAQGEATASSARTYILNWYWLILSDSIVCNCVTCHVLSLCVIYCHFVSFIVT